MKRPDWKHAIALLAGAACVSGFAPFGLYAVPVLALALLFFLWQRAATPRVAAELGFAFGLGLFAAGVNWIYVALHDYGHMPAWLAGPALLLFAAFLALFPALAGFLQARLLEKFAPTELPPAVAPVAGRVAKTSGVALFLPVLVMPAAWAGVEWLRGMIFTGFPWLTLGYAHNASPLAGYAPLLGVYGVSLLAAVSAALLTSLLPVILRDRTLLFRDMWRLGALALLAALWAGGAALSGVTWTQPTGEPFTVTLVQGNIAQDLKFDPEVLNDTLDIYRRLAMQNPARLTVLPETAFPVLADQVPSDLLDQIREQARRNSGDVLYGVFERDAGGYYNSVLAVGASDNAFAEHGPHYRKHHLVIFGEFIPLRPLLGWFINDVLHIPMGDLARGDTRQPPLEVAGQRVAVNICYEDVFGEEIVAALPEATLLVNVTNDAWYGDSYAADQHHQMSQFRALESGRMMLRATNTGVTSIIDAQGRVLQRLPQHQQAVLQGRAQGYQGMTPYARAGNAGVLLLIALMLAGAWGWSRRCQTGARA